MLAPPSAHSLDAEHPRQRYGPRVGGAKTIVITGASDGIGAAAARALAQAGHRIVAVGRSRDKTLRIADEVGATPLVADFASLGQVRHLAERLLAELPCIDVLANNAGGVGGSRPRRTADGYEWTLQVNHFAPFLLTWLLRDRLAESAGRVVVTASRANTRPYARLDPDRLDGFAGYRPMKAYASAKLANVAFTAELPARLPGIRAVCFCPGLVASHFAADGAPLIRTVMGSPARAFMRAPEQGADALVWLATAGEGEFADGAYYSDRKLARRNRVVDDPRFRAALWERTAQAVGATG
jgi:NAD(P)-dependent dehydrogenase (short-subunit alcohol dehydrogenase family)